MKYLVLVVLVVLPLYGGSSSAMIPCVNNTKAKALKQQKKDTFEMLKTKKGDLEDAIDDYKDALEKKKEMMKKLWKTATKIEFLMKENQV